MYCTNYWYIEETFILLFYGKIFNISLKYIYKNIMQVIGNFTNYEIRKFRDTEM